MPDKNARTDTDKKIKLINQNYNKIKNGCKNSLKLFEDETFQANNSILPRKYANDKIVWKRPHV